MQTFTCPNCGHESAYDPWIESAHCDECGYEPIAQGMLAAHRRRPKREPATHQPLLDELLAHWNDTHTPDPEFSLRTADQALAFFEDYRRALGESPDALGGHVKFMRNYQPNRGEILAFVGAYLLLRQGNRAEAARHLRALVMQSKFPDAWIWLTATTGDPAERKEYLEKAITLNSTHPLANGAMTAWRGRVSLIKVGKQPGQQVTTIKCAQCGAELRYEPGAAEVACPHCGHQAAFGQVHKLSGEAMRVGNSRIDRRYQSQTWQGVEHVAHCQSCGAELTTHHHLSLRCALCGSANVLVEDHEWTLEQPDGVLPFAVGKEQAVEAIREAQRTRSKRIKTWLTGKGKAQRKSILRGVYVPFWVFDGFVDVRAWSEGVTIFTPTSGPPEERDEGKMMIENLMFAAVDIPALSRVEGILPYTLGKMTPYTPHFLTDWPALLYNRDVAAVAIKADRAVVTMARQQAKALAAQAPLPPSRVPLALRSFTATGLALGLARHSLHKSGLPHQLAPRSFRTSGLTYQLALLPVWVALLRADEELGLALVNGQTGKVVLGTAVT